MGLLPRSLRVELILCLQNFTHSLEWEEDEGRLQLNEKPAKHIRVADVSSNEIS
jgi:hypothetical protein